MEVKKEIGILQSLGYGKKTIARKLGLSKNTVKSYLDASEDNPGECSNESRREDLYYNLLYCRTELPRKGVTRQILWCETGRDGYNCNQSCEYLK